jgi:hypothetical protein
MRPVSQASTAACARSPRRSFVKIRVTCVFTVVSEKTARQRSRSWTGHGRSDAAPRPRGAGQLAAGGSRSRSATPARYSGCGSGPRTRSPVRPGRPPWWMRTYRPAARRAPARSLAASHPPRDRRLVTGPGGHQDRHVGMELRSLAPRAVPAGDRLAATRPPFLPPSSTAASTADPVRGVQQLAGQIAGRLPAVGQGTSRPDPCPQAVGAGGMAAGHRGGLARAG